MATTVVTLEPRNIAAGVRSLQAGFAGAGLAGVEAVARRGAVHVKAPLAGLSNYHIACGRDEVSWRTPKQKVVVRARGFAIEQRADKNAFHVVFRKAAEEPEAITAREGGSPIRKIFFQRSLRAIEELQTLDEKKLARAVQAPTDYGVLVAALKTEEALASVRAGDPLAGARVRGLEAKRRLIETGGGALPSAEAARLLRITRQAVDKRRREGKLLAVELGRKGFYYPAWQFGLSNLAPVLAALQGRDSWEQLTFFLNPNELLGDRTPLEILAGGKHDIGGVLRAASAYGEQGA